MKLFPATSEAAGEDEREAAEEPEEPAEAPATPVDGFTQSDWAWCAMSPYESLGRPEGSGSDDEEPWWRQ